MIGLSKRLFSTNTLRLSMQSWLYIFGSRKSTVYPSARPALIRSGAYTGFNAYGSYGVLNGLWNICLIDWYCLTIFFNNSFQALLDFQLNFSRFLTIAYLTIFVACCQMQSIHLIIVPQLFFFKSKFDR